MSDNSFSKFVPGFEFLQNLVKNAGSALPGIGQWVAPTLNPEELEKRIDELRTVQFWLEQNARMLGATIQALEVQRMTLSTLKSMNVPLSDLQETLRAATPSAPSASPKPASKPSDSEASDKGSKGNKDQAAAGVVDPLQWWGALTQQFTELASTALKDGTADAASKIVKQSFDAAGESLRKAASAATAATAPTAPTAAPEPAAKPLKPAARTARGAGSKKTTAKAAVKGR